MSEPRAIVRKPAVVAWNRLEPRARSSELGASLRAEIRDPLWMLTRQWQLGELRGEDIGSPILAQVTMETVPVTAVAGPDSPFVACAPGEALEVAVERESAALDVRSRIRIGHKWLALLRAQGLGDAYRALYVAAYPLTLPPGGEELLRVTSEPLTRGWYAAGAGRAVDGGRLLDDLLAGVALEQVTAGALRVDEADRPRVAAQGPELRAWFERLFGAPERRDSPMWLPARLEYQVRCAAGDTVLRADEYHHGHLDWSSFDVETPGRTPRPPGGSAPAVETLSFLPTPAEFPGMPRTRWWEFEDRRVDFGALGADSTDLATLLVAEFGLIYAGDWSVVPFGIRAGTLARVRTLVVTDVFGVRTTLAPAPGDRWAIFAPDGASGSALFVPPSLPTSIESPELERVTVGRDEMANMVWAVEAVVPDGRGGGVDGRRAAADVRRALESPVPPSPAAPASASVRYRVATTVPENWIPFLPVHIPGSNREIQLRRAAMPRAVPGVPADPVRPRTAILLPPPGDQPYFLLEEEVPRAGVTVTRTWQRVRWHEGATLLWIGRRKRSGGRERSSGLAFDQIEPT